MAIGGNIKVTLTLDDAGFTVKSQQAASGIKNMNSEIKGFAGGLEKAETSIKRFGERVQTVSKEFTALNNYAKAASKTLNQLATSNENLDRTTAALNASFANLQATVGQFATRLAGATDSIGKASVSGDALARTNRQIGESTKAAADGMTRQERAARNLGNAQQSVTQQIKLSALATKDAAAVALATEVTNNEKMVASKRTALASMIRAEQEYNRQLEAAKAQAMATSMKLESRRLPNGRMAGANSEYMRDLRYQLQLELDKVKALQQSVNLISTESQRMQSTITAAQQRNAQLREGIALRERDLANVQRYQQAIRDGNMNIINAERAKRAEIAQQNAMVREQMGLVKSLGQMWASMKIYQGEKASVNAASDYQMNELKMRGMGLNDKEIKAFDNDSRAISRNIQGVSITDAQRGYAAAAGGLATKDRGIIMQTLPEAMNAAKNVKFMQGDEHAERLEDLVRNLYGFVEARQQQYQPEAAKSSFDFVLKTYEATGGKIDIKDLETFLRRVGTSANQITDEGLARVVALLDQAKVSGGGGGGGAGGVSTIGTMIKMFQAYGSGKQITNEAVKQFADAGLLNLNGIDPNKQVEAQVTALKRAGLVNNKELAQDPIKAMTQIVNQAFKSMTATPERRKLYFGDANADVNDPENRRAALQKWGTRMGFTTTATNALTTVGDERFQARAEHQHEMIQGAMNNQQFSEARAGTYKAAVDAFDASLRNLQVTLGTTVLPMLTSFFDWLNKVVQAAADFGNNNPMVAQLTMIGGALAGAVLGLKGLSGMMGIVVKAGASFGIFGNSARAASIATGTLGQAAGAALNPFTVLKGTMTGVGQAAGTWATTMSAANTRLANSSTRVLPLIGAQFRFLGTAITSTLGFIGKAFLRAIPFVGWLLLAWDLGGILANFEVGGAKISAWLEKWWNDLLGKGMEWWTKFKGLFDSDDAAKASTEAALKKIKDEADKRQAEFDKQRKDAQARKDADDKAKAENDAKAKAGVDDLNNQKQGATDDPNAGGPLPLGNYNWGADGDKPKRGFEDPFTSSLAEMRRKATIDAQKAGAAIADTGNDLAAEARTAFREKWIAGDFDPGHDPKKRQFKGANGELDWNAQGPGGTPQQWVDQYVAMKRAEDQLKSMQFVKQRVAGAEEDFRNAMERTAGETGKQNRDLAALERELARAGERLKTGTADWAAWAAEKNRALETKAGAVLVNFTADFAEGDRKSMADLAPDGFLKQTAEMDASIQKDREQYEELARNHKKYYDDELAAYKEQLATKQIDNALYTQKVTEATQRYTTSAEKAETAYTQHVQVQNQLRMRAAETAMQRQAREWQNTYSALDTATASWANGLMDNLSTALTGGRADWKSFLRGMLTDLMNIKLKEGLGGLVSGMFSGLQQMLNGSLFSNASTAGSGGGIVNGLSSMWGGVTSLFGGGTGAAASNASGTTGTGTGGQQNAAAAANNQLASAANTATTGLQNMSQTGIMGAITSIGQWIVSLFTGTTASTVKATADTTAATATMTVSTAMLEAALAATNLSIALTAAATTSTATAAFANGGIMSSEGSLPLMKYANGGVANKPQLALFGEGRMNEAYVPLPDGRSIPVTMKGDAMTTAGAGQTVNSVMIEINVTGDGNSGATTGKSSSGGDSNDKTWDVMASRVKGVVMEVLANEKRPNGILTK